MGWIFLMIQCLKASPVYTAALWARASAEADWTSQTDEGEGRLVLKTAIYLCLCHPAQCFRSRLCEQLKGVESTLNNSPISSLRLLPPIFTQKSVSLSLCSLHLISPSLILPPFLTLNALFLSLNCEHHNRTSDVPLLCHASALCPLVLLLGNQPRRRFFGGFHFLCAWLWMTRMHVEEDKESEKHRSRERIGS